MIKENILKTQKTARYYLIGEPNNKIENVWFVLHGYGQLAHEFIMKFNPIYNDKTLIIAPEALNKFYLRGFSGNVGSTWMTKENREHEIDDYLVLLNNIYYEIMNKLENTNIKINLLGFSQGTHTAVRWLDKNKLHVNKLVLWSGTFPHDCNYQENIEYWSKQKAAIIIGKNDKLTSEEEIKSELDFVKAHQLNVELIRYSGGHNIDLEKIDLNQIDL